ncbi:hypothetical protein [Paraflavitalea pollutisoli]|uniref:hypothetical protein n=1 Tax=Paraflavitalea pollutisoli TaxID=3034143 RepID=UPI0023ED8F1C|nr:hypothetical protein [Paraflavitalea sp. H1-2-19X]
MDIGKNILSVLDGFLLAIRQDARISPAHISLYLSILQYCKGQGSMLVRVRREQLAWQAKISTTTYHRCINQLHEYGYIHYLPSFDPKKASEVDVLVKSKNEKK